MHGPHPKSDFTASMPFNRTTDVNSGERRCQDQICVVAKDDIAEIYEADEVMSSFVSIVIL